MNPKTILAVDDDTDFLLLLEKWLTPAYHVLPLSEADGLDEAILSYCPDMVLLDVHMPGVDGIEACRRVRTHGNLRRLPLICLTGSKEDTDFLKAFDAGATRWLTKPITKRDLLAAVAEETGGL